MPTAGCPSAPSAATSPLFTLPARTISATSRVSASVTRSPLMNSLFFPSAFIMRVNCTPPPCTTATWLPSRTSSAMARVQPSASAGVLEPRSAQFDDVLHASPSASFRLPIPQPSITFMFCTACPGRALQQIVKATHDHRAPSARRQAESRYPRSLSAPNTESAEARSHSIRTMGLPAKNFTIHIRSTLARVCGSLKRT